MSDQYERGLETGARAPSYMVVMAWIPVLFLISGAVLASRFSSLSTMLAGFLCWLYLLPPLLCRATLLLWGAPVTDAATPRDSCFKVWWFLTQLQMPFNRVGLLEELLRLVPGLYSLWLNLWGARVSILTFWARDVQISERYLLTIEPGVVVASQTGISGHLVCPDENGVLRLQVAPVVIERWAVLGVRSGLAPGCRLYAGELLPAGRMLPPDHGWQHGRKAKLDQV